MIAGALEFTMGLQANKFLAGLGAGARGLMGFMAVGAGIQNVFSRMWAAIEKGGNLHDLAVRTNTSVKSLYSLQQAFEQIGASAESAGPLILKLQRQLANKEGASLLSSIGLDPKQLQGREAVDQISAISAAIAKLSTSRQSSVAFGLFGREGGATILQIARSGKEFQTAIAATRTDADIWQKVAAKFDTIGDKVKQIQGHIQSMFALLAGALIAAFEKGTLGTLIVDTLSTAFQVSWHALLGAVPLLGAALLDAFRVPLAYLQAGMEIAIDQMANNPVLLNILDAITNGMASKTFKALGVSSGSTTDWQKIMEERLAQGFEMDLGSGLFGNADIKAAAAKNAAEEFGIVAGEVKTFRERLTQLISGFEDNKPRAAGTPTDAGKLGKLSEVTDLEKMGLAMFGLGRGFTQDDARATAVATERTADAVEKIEQKMGKGTENNFANIN